MSRNFVVFMAVALAVVGCQPAAPAAPATPAVPAPARAAAELRPTTETAVSSLAPGVERDLALGRCTLCHTEQYLAQQRLSDAQWQKTVEKMRKWGAPLSADEGVQLAHWLAQQYPVDLADRRRPLAAAPMGAIDR